MNRHSHHTGLYPNKALKDTSPPTIAPTPAMCSLNFHFRLTTMQITIMINAARIIPVMYQGIFRRCIITRQNTYEVIVSKNGIKRRLRSPKSSGLKPLILRNRKMVSVGIRIVKQYTTPSTISLYCIGMMRRYEKRNRIRNARNGMENGVNIADITRAVRIKVLSATICCSSMNRVLKLIITSSVLPPVCSTVACTWLPCGVL